MAVSVGLVGKDKGIRVDRKSVFGNPFYDREVERWQADCDAYRVWLHAAMQTDEFVDVEAIAKDHRVTVAPNWWATPGWYVQKEVAKLRQQLASGQDVCLLCHCKRPFKELGGAESPCHAEAIEELLLRTGRPSSSRGI
eukprot:TRINITY_DN35037_c0_g1_i2.p1 TRINITY_DN35037_c0_g1~~TRINITY_DN35037_c0_g1_i2.p1  ORF type:complete len:155 (-),score=14.17 TRINITY_DN35037_c0_g1_i2:70-486(-)